MHRVIALVAAPVLATMTFGLISTYSSPSELWASVQPVDRELRVVSAGNDHVATVVTDIAAQLPEPASRRTTANSDCFANLALADGKKLDRCARVVYQALIDVEKMNVGSVQQTMDAPDKTRMVEQLKLAATEVCRNAWVNDRVDNALPENPACETAQIQVALDAP
jgi:hypothetical protein